ncbi:hypothetical protein QN277_024037 [Acacia crassicarpa]|uniref:Uncharacterized protein n=1 Tax=Acacia crassicarpa TaxID=499986 RepID=A0AAE1JBC4_9FABA|nr:hypothetical protein QN277_024037 [Acacia crassicarpa]
MISYQMWLNSTGCRVFKRLRPSSGFALHQHLQSLMLKKLVKSFFSGHWYIGRCNILFREFALISLWRVPAMPIGAHTVLSFLLAEPLKQHSETLDEDYNVSRDLREFQDWSV